jgi:hypothetical protein
MTTETAKFKWTEESTAQLQALAGNPGMVVSREVVDQAVAEIGVSLRSILGKLRSLGYQVAAAQKPGSAFSEADTSTLQEYLPSNSGRYTYAELAEVLFNGKYNPRQVQGKILALKLTEHVKPTEKKETVKTYTEAQEAQVIEMINSGAFVEDIATALGKTIAQIRGKALSLLRSNTIEGLPAQRESKAATKSDVFEGLDVANLTIAELAESTGKTERGLKTTLSRRGLVCKDYTPKAKKDKE